MKNDFSQRLYKELVKLEKKLKNCFENIQIFDVSGVFRHIGDPKFVYHSNLRIFYYVKIVFLQKHKGMDYSKDASNLR